MNLLSALLYLQLNSFRNRMATRLRRLKQPKYLIGAIAGLLYFYFYFFRYLFQGVRKEQMQVFAATGDHAPVFLLVGSFLLFIFLALAWIIPRSRTALTFTEAEISFLFPAPVSRRGLIHYKLLRSQAGILFTVLLLTLVTRRLGGTAWMHAISWWLVLSTINLHLLGASFARTMLLDRGISNLRRRLAALLGVALALASIIWWAHSNLTPISEELFTDNALLLAYVESVLGDGPAFYLLLPFRLLLGPYLAADLSGFLAALPAAVLILVGHYIWVIRSNVAFEEASADASRRLAEKVAAIRAGNWQAAQDKPKPGREPFNLSPSGAPYVAFLWKNLISAGRIFSLRLWFVLLAAGAGMALGITSISSAKNMAMFLGAMSAMFLFWALLIGPQILRQDFRQDLAMVDYLKQLPLSGWQIAWGQILAPVVILTGIQWILVVTSAVFLAKGSHFAPGFPAVTAIASALIILLPFLNAILLLIPNAAVLLYPAWFTSGKDAPQGIEATGQRLVAILAQFVVFIIAIIPATIAFTLVLLLLQLAIWVYAAVPFAALAAAAVLALEAAISLRLLGHFFERLDPSTELDSK